MGWVGPKPPKTTEISGRDGQPITIAHLVLHLDEIQRELRSRDAHREGVSKGEDENRC